jgi:hypothetical protein
MDLPTKVFRSIRSVAKEILDVLWAITRKPAVFGVGVGVLGVVFAITYATDFNLSIAVLIIVALWSIAFWVDSQILKKKKPLRPRPRNKNYEDALSRFNRGMLKYRIWQISGVLTVLVLLTISVTFVRYKWNEKELSSLSEALVPSDEATPEIPCAQPYPPNNAVKVFFDGAVAIITKFPHTIISANHDPRFAINNHDGTVSISATVVSGDGRIVAEIKDNKFLVNQLNYLTMDRADRSSLKVRDQQGKTVLDVTLLNKYALVVSAFVVYLKSGDVTELASSVKPGICFGDSAERSNGDFDFTRTPGQDMQLTYKPYTGFGAIKNSVGAPAQGKTGIVKIDTTHK